MIKRYLAECLGTFVIVFAPVAMSASGALYRSDATLTAAAWVSGLSVLSMIYALGPISAAHFNPAVTLSFAITRRFPWRLVLPYWMAQFSGAIAAGGLVTVLLGPGHGVHIPGDPALIGRNLGMEAVLSFILMLVIVAVATDARVDGAVPALAIGFTVVLCVLIGGPVTGGSMNPARSFGPAVFVGGAPMANYWLYVLGPCVGAPLGALAYEGLRLERRHAVGAPNEILEALAEVSASVTGTD